MKGLPKLGGRGNPQMGERPQNSHTQWCPRQATKMTFSHTIKKWSLEIAINP